MRADKGTGGGVSLKEGMGGRTRDGGGVDGLDGGYMF